MMERQERKPYWRQTKWQTFLTLGPFLLAVALFPIFGNELNSNKFLGFPLGYFLASHGLVILAVVAVASYVSRQDVIDHWHGAHEDI